MSTKFSYRLQVSFLRIGGVGCPYKITDFPRLSESGSLGSKAWEFVIIKLCDDSMEKEMATHSSILAWEIPWMERPDRLQFMGLQRAGHNLRTKQTKQQKEMTHTRGQV